MPSCWKRECRYSARLTISGILLFLILSKLASIYHVVVEISGMAALVEDLRSAETIRGPEEDISEFVVQIEILKGWPRFGHENHFQ